MMRRSKSERRVSHAALKIFFEIYAAKFYIWFLNKFKNLSFDSFYLSKIVVSLITNQWQSDGKHSFLKSFSAN